MAQARTQASPYVPPLVSERPTEAEMAARAADVRMALTAAERETSERLRSMILMRANVSTLLDHLTEFALRRAQSDRPEPTGDIPRLSQLIEQARAGAHPHDAQVFSRLHRLLVVLESLPIVPEAARQIQTVFTPLTPFTSIDSDSDSEVKTPTLWDRLETED
jgi:hypothetical protein